MPILYERTTVCDSYFSDTRLLVREQEWGSSMWMPDPETEGGHDIGSGLIIQGEVPLYLNGVGRAGC